MLPRVGGTVKRAVRSHRGEAKHNTDLVCVDLDSFDQGTNELATCLPIGVLQTGAHLSGELLQPPDDQAELAVAFGLVLEALQRLLRLAAAFPQAGDAWLKLGFVNEALGVAIDQARNPPTERAELAPYSVMLLGSHGGEETPAIFLFEPRRLFEHPAHLLPNRVVDHIHAGLRVAA